MKSATMLTMRFRKQHRNACAICAFGPCRMTIYVLQPIYRDGRIITKLPQRTCAWTLPSY